MTTDLIESAEGGNERRNDFMINLHESYITELEFDFFARLDLQLDTRPFVLWRPAALMHTLI